MLAAYVGVFFTITSGFSDDRRAGKYLRLTGKIHRAVLFPCPATAFSFEKGVPYFNKLI